jgi:hypothetical protein
MTATRSATSIAPSLPSNDGAFDALIRDMLGVVQDMTTQATSTTATVTGRSGGGVIVHIDGEQNSRTLPFARKKGVRYSVGNRVSLKPTRGGDWVVDGLVSSDPYEPSVFSEQIDPDIISRVNASATQVQINSLQNQINSLQSQHNSLETRHGNLSEKVTAVSGAANRADAHAQNVYDILNPRISALEKKKKK